MKTFSSIPKIVTLFGGKKLKGHKNNELDEVIREESDEREESKGSGK